MTPMTNPHVSKMGQKWVVYLYLGWSETGSREYGCVCDSWEMAMRGAWYLRGRYLR